MTGKAHISAPADWQPGRETFTVAALFERAEANDNPWLDYRWRLLGVLCGDELPESGAGGVIHDEDAISQRLFSGLELRFHPDEAESYYHNLTVEQPRIYVIARDGSNGPEPFMATASFDVANAHVEADDLAFDTALPAELYPALEHFVVGHFFPEKRRKRKRDNWKDKR
jgi:hypothetical protein